MARYVLFTDCRPKECLVCVLGSLGNVPVFLARVSGGRTDICCGLESKTRSW